MQTTKDLDLSGGLYMVHSVVVIDTEAVSFTLQPTRTQQEARIELSWEMMSTAE